MHAKISISRGKRIWILPWNLTTMKELTALQYKDMGIALGKYTSATQGVGPTYIYDEVVNSSLSLCLGLLSFDKHIIRAP